MIYLPHILILIAIICAVLSLARVSSPVDLNAIAILCVVGYLLLGRG